ncbi:hypothetical protein [uncultured Rhodoblastus sp.]|uniref:hypothetical protein n=1 Tax=uncultured Rhodoblastus sp. TaxID=543037 RepID=UPI0025FA7C0B|nr:hypothetical protein [uncultured Rhodoblastus sp.]
MMKRILPFLVLFALACPARAEFSLVSSEAEVPSSPDAAAMPGPGASTAPETTRPLKPQAPSSKHRAAAEAPKKTVGVAAGFGAQVPLAFAIRQMAPDGYEIVLEPPADPDTVVDWRGGKVWTRTLADAVQPLGLTVSVHDKTVTIGPARAQ